jgi:hypothetical protein
MKTFSTRLLTDAATAMGYELEGPTDIGCFDLYIPGSRFPDLEGVSRAMPSIIPTIRKKRQRCRAWCRYGADTAACS